MKYIKILIVTFFIFSLAVFGASVIRTIVTQDPTKPEITSDREELEISTSYEEEDLLQGLTASDGKDGDLTDQIMAGDFSQFSEPGVCSLSYVVFDSSNQAASLTRQIRFTDYESPKFTLSEPLVFIEGEEDNGLSRIGASDSIDGDISSLVRILDNTINYQLSGDYTVRAQITNSLGDTQDVLLPAHVITASCARAHIQLKHPLVYIKPGSEFHPEDYVDYIENEEGDRVGTDALSVTSRVDTRTEGVYEVRYQTDGDTGRGETWLTVIVRE